MNKKQAVRIGAILGLWAVAAYFIAISISLPPLLNRINSYSLGLLLIAACYSLFVLLRVHN